MKRLVLQPAVRTHPGLRRSHNEDHVFGTPRLVAVADGVGGAAAGEVASGAAIGTLVQLEKRWLSEALPDELENAIREGNDRIAFIAECRPEYAGMGTTVTAVAIEDRYVVAHIGDSRGYLFRDGALTQLTRDDSLILELVDSGALDPAAARRHPQRSEAQTACSRSRRAPPTTSRSSWRTSCQLPEKSGAGGSQTKPERQFVPRPWPPRALPKTGARSAPVDA